MNQKPVLTNCQPRVGREEMELNCRQEAEEPLWTYYVAYEDRSVLSPFSRNPGLYYQDSKDEMP